MENSVNQDTQTGSTLQGLKKSSLKAAGWSYLLGDAALATAKMLEGDKAGAAGAAMWGVGGAAAAVFGNPSAEKELELLQHRLGNYLREQGIAIPENPSTAELTKQGGILDHIEHFLYAYPSQMLNATYAAGAAMTLKGGISKKKTADIASGALVMAGALAGLLIPEKKPDPQHPAEGVLGRAKEWIQEKPLRASGGFYLLNNGFMFKGAYDQQKMNAAKGSNSHWFRYLTGASYVLANVLLSLSSKDNGTASGAAEDAKTLHTLAQSVASVVAAQPPEVQTALVNQIAGYLATQPGMHAPADEIAATMQSALAAQKATVPQGHWQQKLAHESSVSSPAPLLS